MNKYAVIMAGGSGQRLWPLSRQKMPKQMIKVIKGKSLLEICIDRIKSIFPLENIYIVTNQQYKGIVEGHLEGIPKDNILGEPVGRDTANAIGFAANIIYQKDRDSAMAVFSADQVISPVRELQSGIQAGFDFVNSNPDVLMTLGIKATSAHTGFGYIKQGEATKSSKVFRVDQFKEKPDIATAQRYLESGNYCWNSGMFLWKTGTILAEINKSLPENAEGLLKITSMWGSDQAEAFLSEVFPTLPKISIDYGIMEKAAKVCMIKLDCDWQDVGSFEALTSNIGQVDCHNNSIAHGIETVLDNCSGIIIISDDSSHLIAGIDIEDLVVVHTKDATLICRKGSTDKLKVLLDKIDEKHK